MVSQVYRDNSRFFEAPLVSVANGAHLRKAKQSKCALIHYPLGNVRGPFGAKSKAVYRGKKNYSGDKISMAIFHFHGKVIGRSDGKNAVQSAAYRCGQSYRDEKTGVLYNYSKKSDVAEVIVLAPAMAPAWVYDPALLWNNVEKVEKRGDAQLARDFDIALPRELTPEQRRDLAMDFVQEQFTNRGMVAMVAFHGVDSDNPHVHVMCSTRELTPKGFGKKNRDWNDRGLMDVWRERWETHANNALERAGRPERIDRRTLAAQGIDREPEQHQGFHAAAMERRGLAVDRTRLKTPVLDPTMEKIVQSMESNGVNPQIVEFLKKKVHLETREILSLASGKPKTTQPDPKFTQRLFPANPFSSPVPSNPLKSPKATPLPRQDKGPMGPDDRKQGKYKVTHAEPEKGFSRKM